MAEAVRGARGSVGGFPPKSKEIRDYRDLRVWRKSRRLAELCGDAVAGFPEPQVKAGQSIRRLAEEVADEIATGQSLGQHAAYMNHLERSRAALRHLERRLIEAHKVGCLPAERGDPLLARTAEIERMVGKLMVSLALAHARRRAPRTGM